MIMWIDLDNVKDAILVYILDFQNYLISQQTRHIDPVLDQCRPTVTYIGPALVHHWIDVSCLLGYGITVWSL